MRKSIFAFVAMLSPLFVFFACDNVESEDPGESTVTEFTNNVIVITPASSGIIDLRSLITSSGNYKFQISTQPLHGSLQSMGAGVIKYTVNEGIANANDGFKVSILSIGNTFLKEDSIAIKITQDSTSMPCGLHALTDYVMDSAFTSGSLLFDVLANDVKCGLDASKLQVSVPSDLVIAGTPIPPSYFGTVQVLSDNTIKYTPGAEFSGQDKFVYKVVKPANIPEQGDPEVVAYGFVYIYANVPCKTTTLVRSDSVTLHLSDTASSDTTQFNEVHFTVTDNDDFCADASDLSFTIIEMPLGELVDPKIGYFTYRAPQNSQAGFSDRFRYRLCANGVCGEGEVNISTK